MLRARLGDAKKWKVGGGLYKPFNDEAVQLLKGNENRIKFDWVPRDKNEICDVLSKFRRLHVT